VLIDVEHVFELSLDLELGATAVFTER